MSIYDFSKNMQVEEMASVPEKYQGLYEDNPDGGFRVTDAAKGIVADYSGTSTALAEATGKTKSANDESASRRVKLKAFDTFAQENGFEGEDSFEAIKTGFAGLSDQVKGGAAAKVNLNKVNDDWQKRFDELEGTAQGKVDRMTGTLTRHLIGEAGTKAISEAKGSVELLLPHIVKHSRVTQDGDDFVTRVVDGAGDNRMNGAGGFMTIADLVTELKSDAKFGRAFDSEAPGGTGTPPGGGHKKPAPKGTDMAANEKITAGLDALKGAR